MRISRHLRSVPSLLKRVVAIVAAGVVMLLALSSVSPELHAWLHKSGSSAEAHQCCQHASDAKTDPVAHASSPGSSESEGHGCAITMFAHGVVQPAAVLLAQPCEGILRAVDFRAFERLALAQPRFLHLPPQAPPAA